MRKFSFVMVAILGLLFLGGNVAESCPQKPKCGWKNCVCKCFKKPSCNKSCKDQKCPCGETCKLVKKCKIFKYCKMVKKCCMVKKCKMTKVKVKYIGKCGKVCYKYVWKNKCWFVKKCSWIKKCWIKKCCKMVKKCKCNKCPPCPTCDDSGPSVEDAEPYSPDQGVLPSPDQSIPLSPDQGVLPNPDQNVPLNPDQGVPVEPDQGVAPIEPDQNVAPVEPDGGVKPDINLLLQPDMEVVEPDAEIVETDGPCATCPDSFVEEKKAEDLLLQGGGCSVGDYGNNGLVGGIMVLAILGVICAFIRKSKNFLVLCFLLLSGTVYAKPNLPAPKFQPVSGPADYLQTRGVDVLPHFKFSTGTMFSFERRPLEIVYKNSGAALTDVIQHRYNLDLFLAIGLMDRIELGLALPFAMGQVSKGLNYLGDVHSSSLDGGVGDLRLSSKLKLWKGEYFGFGLAAPLTFPTASLDEFFGENSFTFSPAALADFNTTYFGVAINAGYRVRGDKSINFRSQDIIINDELFGSVGVRTTVVKNKIDLIGDAFFSVPVKSQEIEEVPVEILGGMRFHLPYGVMANIGGGAGLTRGAGAPTYRILAGLSWSPSEEKVRKVVVKSPPEMVYTECPECPSCPLPVVCPKCPLPIVCNKCGEVVIPPVFFDFDKDYLKATSIPVMLKVVEMIKKNPQIKKIVVNGHTDSIGSDEYNLFLGIRRARFVKEFLSKYNIKLYLVGSYGEKVPYTSNKTKDGRAQNRRVEFEIVR